MAAGTGWGIIGTNGVAGSMALAIARTAGHRVARVASGQRVNAERFVRTHGGAVADSVAALVADPDVGCVYVASPTSSHEEHALQALAAGKPVLVEKPFAVDAAGAERVVRQARASGVFCMEAAWTRFLPLVAAIGRTVASGGIGPVRQMTSSFCRADQRDPQRNLFRADRGGGALLQRGFYGITLARMLLGPVEGVKASARIGPTGVDEDCTVMLMHRSGAISITRASLVSQAPQEPIMVQGEAGTIRIDPPVFRPTSARLFRTTAMAESHAGGMKGAVREKPWAHLLRQHLEPRLRALRPGGSAMSHPYAGNGYDHQVMAVGEALAVGLTESPVMPLDETLDVMRILDAARRDWEVVA